MLYKTAFWGALGKGDTMKREDGESMSKVISVTEMFGKDVFNDAVMRDRLPKSVYKKLKKTIEDGAELDPSIADVVAHAMKDWAIDMVQPILLTGSSLLQALRLRSTIPLFPLPLKAV